MLLNLRSTHLQGLVCSAATLLLTGSLFAASPNEPPRSNSRSGDPETVQEESGWRKFWKLGSTRKKPVAKSKPQIEGAYERRDQHRARQETRHAASPTPGQSATAGQLPPQRTLNGGWPGDPSGPVSIRVHQAGVNDANSQRNIQARETQAETLRNSTSQEPRRLAARGVHGEPRTIGDASQPKVSQPSQTRSNEKIQSRPTRSRVTTADGEAGENSRRGNILPLSAETSATELSDPFAERSALKGPELTGPRHRMSDLQLDQGEIRGEKPGAKLYRIPSNRLEKTVIAPAAPYDEPVQQFDVAPPRNETVYTTQDYYREEPGHEYQVLPNGLMYQSYLAGEKEPRLGSQWLYESKSKENLWESTLGGRVGLLRKGTTTNMRPEGWQIDLEGAVMTRLNNDYAQDVDAMDFRFGMLWTHRRGTTAWKAGYYHLSSHAGDEYMVRNPGFVRLNYVRENFVVGVSEDLTDDVRVYAEAAYGFHVSDGAKPWEFQFGAEYSPYHARGKDGAPFAAANLHLREECDFGGSINLQAGWQWRGEENDRRFRVGLQYYKGHGLQYEFYDRREELVGLGIWYDY